MLPLLFLRRGAGFFYHLYDSFTRSNSDTLGSSEGGGPSGKSPVLAWTAIGGDLDILSNAVQGGDAQSEILDPGFETVTGTADDGVTDNWDDWAEDTGANGIVDSTATVHAGSKAVKIINSTPSSYPAIRQNVSVTAGKLYYVGAWGRNDGVAGNGLFNVRDDTNSVNLKQTSSGLDTATYGLYELVVAAPTGCTQLRLRLYHGGAGTTIYWDDASLKECHAAEIDPGVADGTFTANITTPSSGTAPFGLIVRRDGATQWLVQITPGTAGTDFELVELNNGVHTIRATADIDWTADTSYKIDVIMSGTTITVEVDGSQELNYASASVGQSNTKVGLWDSLEGNALFEDVSLPN